MIIDNMKRLEAYAFLGPNFAKAAAFLKNMDADRIPVGPVEIDGKKVYGSVTEKTLTDIPDFWEVHRAYADIQIVLRGRECIGYYPLDRLDQLPEFEEGKDAVLFHDLEGTDCILQDGEMAILLPQDIHRPNCPAGKESFSRKLLLKIALQDE